MKYTTRTKRQTTTTFTTRVIFLILLLFSGEDFPYTDGIYSEVIVVGWDGVIVVVWDGCGVTIFVKVGDRDVEFCTQGGGLCSESH